MTAADAGTAAHALIESSCGDLAPLLQQIRHHTEARGYED
jgi:hypothetical protein